MKISRCSRFFVRAKTPNAKIRAMLFDVGVADAHSRLPRGNWMVLRLSELKDDDVKKRLESS